LWTPENRQNFNEDIRCPHRYSKWQTPEIKSDVFVFQPMIRGMAKIQEGERKSRNVNIKMEMHDTI
jgi:hypothetical protein